MPIAPAPTRCVAAPARAPLIGLAPWSRAPGCPAATLALATADSARQRMLAAAIAPSVRFPLPRAVVRGHLRLVPDAAIVDSPALLAHSDVAGLLASRVIVIGAGDDVDRSVAMLVAGAGALLPTDVTAPQLREAVRCVLRGEAVVPPAVAAAVAERVRAAEALGQKPPARRPTG
jgi:hypothetical protein